MTIWKTNITDPNLKIVTMDFRVQSDFNEAPFLAKTRQVIGIGFETKRDGAHLRAAVEIRSEPSPEELQEAIGLLFKAYTSPESDDVKVVRGHVELTPNVMQTTALIERTKTEAK
jgi:hypothetical protein